MKQQNTPQDDVRIIRILGKDIYGNKKVLAGLNNIKGISWILSNAICTKLKIDKNKRIDELSEDELKKIEEFLSSSESELYDFLKNRRNDRETGKNKHLITNDLDLQKEFDVKRMKKVKSYKGVRHSLGQPVRGQRTKSNFRKNKTKSGGIKKKR